MGIDSNHARFLLSAFRRGVSFRRTVMLGRQFCSLTEGELQTLVREFDLEPTAELMEICNNYAEGLFRFLGAEQVISIDAHSYQGASDLHDMNLPIPAHLRDGFDVVVEGGTLEHVFNFPVAVQNCMSMLATGGHFLGISPANNFCGHGFYQFSPDLFFRVFSAENGFLLERAILCEVQPDSQWFEALDPLAEGQFVEFVNSKPTYLLVQAKKTESRLPFQEYPQQSVYTQVWNANYPGNDAKRMMRPISRV